MRPVFAQKCRIAQTVLIGLAAVVAWGAGAGGRAQNLGNLLENGGFEVQVPPLNPTPASYYIIDASRVPGWNTSARDNKIELWSSGFSSGSGGPVYSITPAQSTAAGDVFFPAGGGSFFAELNATQPSTLSQTVSLAKTGMLSYSFWTRGRAGYDTMKLEVQKLENGAWRTVH
jgi:hypothetical protein